MNNIDKYKAKLTKKQAQIVNIKNVKKDFTTDVVDIRKMSDYYEQLVLSKNKSNQCHRFIKNI